jgi:hypothetical protein
MSKKDLEDVLYETREYLAETREHLLKVRERVTALEKLAEEHGWEVPRP